MTHTVELHETVDVLCVWALVLYAADVGDYATERDCIVTGVRYSTDRNAKQPSVSQRSYAACVTSPFR